MVSDILDPTGGYLSDENEAFARAVTVEVEVGAVLADVLDSANEKFAFIWPRFVRASHYLPVPFTRGRRQWCFQQAGPFHLLGEPRWLRRSSRRSRLTPFRK
jgi:hypothetical protein